MTPAAADDDGGIAAAVVATVDHKNLVPLQARI